MNNFVLRTVSFTPEMDKKIEENKGQLPRSRYIENMVKLGMSANLPK